MIDDLNVASTQIQSGSIISGIVGGFVDNGEDFILNFSGGSTIVDTSLLNTNQLGLNIGESVNIAVKEFDGLEIDAGAIATPDDLISATQIGFPPPLPPFAPDPLTGFNPVIPPQGNPIFGTVVAIVDNDEFFLQDANGTQILVDTDLPDTQFLNLVPGEQVNVTGIFDDNDFEAFSVTRLDGSPVFTAPPGNPISGTVVSVVDNDEFLLQDANGTQILVDTDLPDTQFLNLVPGEQVNVVGNFDDDDFDAFSVTRPDGSPVFTNTPVVPPPPAFNPVLPPTPGFNPVIPPPGNPIFGTVVGIVDNDEFFLQDANGTQILVDTDLPDTQFLNLVPGEQVNVTGIFDDNDFEAFSVTRLDGSPVFTAPPGNPISGTVVSVVDNDEFLLQDPNGTQILVDTDLPDTQFLNLVPGEQVNVVGNFDDDDFDAFSVTRPDGSPVFTNTPVVPPPPAFNPVLPPPPGFNPVIPPPGNPIFGTVVGIVDNDEFLLDTNGTQILVDTDLPDTQFLNLVPGEQVNVTGIFDEDGFDAFSVTRPDGSPVFTNTPVLPPPPTFNPVLPPPPAFNPVLPPPPTFNPVIPPQGNPISGTVVGLLDNDEFLLDTNGTQILVDTDLPDTQFLNLLPGEQVNVTGIFDEDGFDAVSVTRLDASPVFTAPQ